LNPSPAWELLLKLCISVSGQVLRLPVGGINSNAAPAPNEPPPLVVPQSAPLTASNRRPPCGSEPSTPRLKGNSTVSVHAPPLTAGGVKENTVPGKAVVP
jgi:hypothetical protein